MELLQPMIFILFYEIIQKLLIILTVYIFWTFSNYLI